MEQEVLKQVKNYLEQYDNASVQKQSFDFFIHHRLNKIIEEEPTIEVPIDEDGTRFYRVRFGQVFVDKPYIIDEKREVRYITPNEARIRDFTYSSAISVNIRTCIVSNDIETCHKDFFKVLIARIPMMIGTSKCNLYDMLPEQKKQAGECPYDSGGYFIVRGKERVLVSQERMNHNVVYVFEQKPAAKFLLVAEIRSMSEETGHSVLIQMKITNDKQIVLQIPYISQEIPLGIVMRAFQLNIEEIEKILLLNIGKDIVQQDPMIMRIVRSVIRMAETMDSSEKAIAYISQFAVHNVTKERKLFYVNQILHNELFPHLGITSSRQQKAFFIGHMFSKLVLTHIGHRPMDDRDHINNKRVEVSGHLLSELFRTLFKRFVRAIEPQLVKRPDVMVIISRINIITQGIKHCFSTGNWGLPKSSYVRTGVSQILSRLTYNAFLSHLRRILIPVGKEGKNTKIRQVHPSQIGFICPHETPEGHCLVGDTDILLNDGISVLPISDFEKNPQVMVTTVKKETGKTHGSHFTNFFSVMPESLFEIVLINGASIKASGLHPFLVGMRDKDPEWVPVQELKKGDLLAYKLSYKRLTNKSWYKKLLCFEKISRKCPLLKPFKDYIDEITTEWKYLTIAARLFGLGCFSFLYNSQRDVIMVNPLWDVDDIFMDLKTILPFQDVSISSINKIQLGECSVAFLSALFELDEWTQSLRFPEWICEGNDATCREFLGGLFTAWGYSIVTLADNNKGFRPEDLVISVEYPIIVQNKDLKRMGKELQKMLNGLCPKWDLVTHHETNLIKLIPQEKDILSILHTLGIRYDCRWEMQVSSFLLFQQTLSCWRSYDNMMKTIFPYPESCLLYLPIKSIRSIEKEITMDFTTVHENHSFVANGFVTHNSAGIVKNMALSVQVTTRTDTVYLRMILENIPSLIPVAQIEKEKDLGLFYKVFINGNWIGISRDKSIYETMCRYKKEGRFSMMVSISANDKEREIHVYGDEGRMIRPLWNAKNLPTIHDLQTKDIQTLLAEKKMVFLDSYEIESKVIAMTISEAMENSFYDFCEIHPSLLMGLCVSIIPYVDHTQAPRVTYHASMGKQAIGYYATTHRQRTDTISHVLCYPEKPLIRTHYGEFTGCDDLATGNNLIVAICMYTGFNQEDSVIFNQSAIDRGLFRSFSYRTMLVEERKKSTTHTESIELPPLDLRVKSFNYSKLNAQGIIKVGVFVGSGDVIVGRVQTKINKTGTEEKIDTSVILKSGEEGYIDRVYSMCSPDGYRLVKVKVRTLKIPEIGDKVASRSAQKGTIGMIYRHEDMPFTASGMVPDLIINPLCIPSRMTINQLIECLGAKSAAHKAIHRYSTPFSSHSIDVVDSLRTELRQCGFEQNGNEKMFNGFTGECFQSEVFIGPTYYHRLKHLVSAKIHARNHGSLQALTRQPLEGRSRDGGLRFGEMERDALRTGTPISLHCGLSVKIDDMNETGWKVLSWDKEKNGIVCSLQTEFLDKGFRDCLEITLEDGRKLYPSIRHPLLTSSNEWMLAQDITPGTILQVNLENPLMDIHKEMTECNQWTLHVGNYTYFTDSVQNYLKTLAFMRVLGYLITDGHITKQGHCGKIFMGHILDVESIIEDIQMAFGTTTTYKFIKDSYYDVRVPSNVIQNLLCIDGIIRGNKTTQACKIPTFLLEPNCPRYIIREFLGGMFGGDGHTCYLSMHRKKRDLLTSVSISKSNQYCLITQLEDYMKGILYLLERCEIHKSTLQKGKETTSSKKRQDISTDEKIYSMTLHIDKDDLMVFHQNVGFRHCLHKSMRLEAAVSYHRLRKNVKYQHDWIVQRVDELTAFSHQKKENPNKKVPTKKAIEKAVKELKSTQGLLHEYAIPSTHDITDHLVKGTSFGKFSSSSFPTAKQYIQQIGCLDWFISVRSDEAISYGTRRGDDFLRTMNLKVVFVKPIGPQKVFDIQVEKTESFLANGVVAHNCMISHGVSRFLTERLFDMSDKFTVPVCSQCGGIPNSIETCNHCESFQIRRTPLPYACKLLFQELQAMGIKIRLFPMDTL